MKEDKHMTLINLLNTLNVPNAAGYVTITDDNEIKAFHGEIQGTAQNLLFTMNDKILFMEVWSIRQDAKCNMFPVLHVFLKED